ncbi:MAG: shikimate dehydrogenase [Chloroflexi bacterium]|nr:MAG: shikimate dehydrogenase [Chloroflexota bacterium]
MTARVGLIGHPLDHSISPAFQQAAFDAVGIDARYEAWDLPPEQLEDFIAGLRRPDALGANVTIPYKEAALHHVDRLHETARFVGAINTIVNEGGHLAGYNTDVAGFQAALKDAGVETRGANVVIWGAGGAARAVAWALIWRGVNGITVINRTPVRAGRLRHDIAAAITGGKPQGVRLRAYAADHPDAIEALRLCDIVVNCTPIGMQRSAATPDQSAPETPFPVDPLSAGALVIDLIANPLQTPLMRQATTAGHRVLGGLPMLVHQGAASFELWTRRAPPMATMNSAAQTAMQAMQPIQDAP